ncbi:hypothetical protein [Ureibacillus chungkukjangi]|uniref:Uncharacterized protein n=1 Tax=Ureibacillus chungkukjangi TaxID=1202712 RepID=A0A318U5U1_9BACL|nr:hypothetical protein [Ureibacillus chungkukjangi]MCM3388463.1 hypothetical protein [Ureibacillus chungkukjangi]PYF07289.1 hypothetical protein BJ095_10579 [Ureibacillus chungkukjangi]
MGLDWNSNKDTNDDRGNNRIESEVIFERNSLIIGQNFCVNATIGGEQKLIIEEDSITENNQEDTTIDDSSNFFPETDTVEEPPKNQDYTLIYAAPASPMRAPLLITVIARNLSDNDVLISMEDDDEVLVEEIVPANSELALTAQNALFIRALALEESHVQFFISVYHPTNPY